MMHTPISLHNITLAFGNKTLVRNCSAQIHFGSRIAIVGRNGSGKSTLLKLVAGLNKASSGELRVPAEVSFGYVPQVIENFSDLSGGQRFNKALSSALAANPNVLLLDEPTNHLDASCRKSLLRSLNKFYGTLIIVTHDIEVLHNCVDKIWQLEAGDLTEFTGNYADFRREIALKRAALTKKLSSLQREKHALHASLMQEQTRAANSKQRGRKHIQQKKWPTVKSPAKVARGNTTSDRKKTLIDKKKRAFTEELSALHSPEVIMPSFDLSASTLKPGVVVSIQHASISYTGTEPLVYEINMSLYATDRMAVRGDNGSGKTSLIKAILGTSAIIKTGAWKVPARQDIGYLDQHYANIEAHKTVLEALSAWVPRWSVTEIRRHLNTFLFRTDQDVNTLGRNLSGGEKARLSLALIAAKPPKLLILDEVTNNLDLETKQHVAQTLKDYPAAMLVVSHDQEFLNNINIQTMAMLSNGCMQVARLADT